MRVVPFTEEELQNIKYKKNKQAVKIYDSYRVRKRDFAKVLDKIKNENPEMELFKNRSYFNMKMEWSVHNFFFTIGFYAHKVADVDLDYEMIPFEKFVFNTIGLFGWIFIK